MGRFRAYLFPTPQLSTLVVNKSSVDPVRYIGSFWGHRLPSDRTAMPLHPRSPLAGSAISHVLQAVLNKHGKMKFPGKYGRHAARRLLA
jgi:hypothetical protein